MQTILKGNNVSLSWTITIDGESVDLTDKDVKVYIISNRFRKSVVLTKAANVLSFDFNGTEQPFDGTYDLELIIDEGEATQQRLYESNVFELVEPNREINISTNISEE